MMGADSRRLGYVRVVAAAVLILGSAPVIASYAAGPPRADEPLPDGNGAITAVSIDGVGPGQLVAYGPGGDVVYRNESRDLYHDIDPYPGGDRTVTYAASDVGLPDSACDRSSCIRNVVERVNLSTGDVERVYSRVGPSVGSSQIHGVDWVNETTLLVGDIGPPDRVYMVNVTTGEKIWEWRVAEAYSKESGGTYPGDWTHLNDVEYLRDGRVMVSLRNQDQVVFVDPGEGLIEDWTLGADDEYDVLYEQHNPDYIPAERGGPAVLVADSENNRVVEYRRADGGWVRSWTWRDARLQWPRDADRLPGGRTLIVDSHGNRVFEVNRSGAVVWKAPFPDGGYDAEVIGTGDESAGGESATRLSYVSRTESLPRGDPGLLATARRLTDLLPSILLHGFLYALPDWVTPIGAVALALQFATAVGWIGTEAAAAYRS